MSSCSAPRALTIATLVAVLLLAPPATAAMTADYTAVPSTGDPLTVIFTDHSSPSTLYGAVGEWSWEFGDGSGSNIQNPSHTYTAPGTYTVRLTVRAIGSVEFADEDSVGKAITVRAPTTTITTVVPSPVLILSPVSGEASTTIMVTGESFDTLNKEFPEAVSITFDGQRVGSVPVNNGDFTTTITVPAGTAAGPHTVGASTLVTAKEALFSVPPTDTPTIPSIPPSIEQTYSPTLILYPTVSGSTITVGGTAAAGTAGTTITRIAWNWGDGTTEDHAVPNTHAYAAAGTYTVTVTAYQSDGQSTSRTVNVPINGPTVTTTVPTTTTPPPANAPTAAFTWSASATNGRDIRFTDASTGIITAWSWQFGDDATAVGQNAGHVYAQAGNYTVTLTVTGPGGTSTAARGIGIGDAATPYVTPTVTTTTVPATVTEITVMPTATDRQPSPDFPWWLAAIVAIGLLAGGVALAKGAGRRPPTPKERVPGLTVQVRGGMRRPMAARPPARREAEIGIEVRGGMRHER